MNWGDFNRFSYLYTVCLKTIDHLNLKLWIFSGHIASFKIEILKVQDCEPSPCGNQVYLELKMYKYVV